MKSSEFRYGNLHFYDGKIDRIDWRYVLAFQHDFLDGIEAIEITEDWLLRFGFKKLDKYSFVNKKVFIHKRKRGFVYGGKRMNLIIRHVHQLQNLYFALTGDELILKSF